MLGKMRGRSRAQVTRLVQRYGISGLVEQRKYRRNRFASRCTAADVELPSVDEAHGCLSGPATQKMLYREFYDYGEQEWARLANISVAHIYNLR